MRAVTVALVVLGVVSLAGAATAQNLLTNPDFNTDADSWTMMGGRVEWIAGDGNPSGSGSGCLETGGTTNNNGFTGRNQEVAVEPDTDYVLAGSGWIPAASPAQCIALWVGWYDASHHFISFSDCFSYCENNTPWTRLHGQVTSPSTAARGQFRPGFQYSNGGTIESYVRWDDLVFSPAAVFSNGFESGTMDAWSSHVPD